MGPKVAYIHETSQRHARLGALSRLTVRGSLARVLKGTLATNSERNATVCVMEEKGGRLATQYHAQAVDALNGGLLSAAAKNPERGLEWRDFVKTVGEIKLPTQGQVVSGLLNSMPVVSFYKGMYEHGTGLDMVTGERVSENEAIFTMVTGSIISAVKFEARGTAGAIGAVADEGKLFSHTGGKAMDPSEYARIKAAFERKPGRYIVDDEHGASRLDELEQKSGAKIEGWAMSKT